MHKIVTARKPRFRKIFFIIALKDEKISNFMTKTMNIKNSYGILMVARMRDLAKSLVRGSSSTSPSACNKPRGRSRAIYE